MVFVAQLMGLVLLVVGASNFLVPSSSENGDEIKAAQPVEISASANAYLDSQLIAAKERHASPALTRYLVSLLMQLSSASKPSSDSDSSGVEESGLVHWMERVRSATQRKRLDEAEADITQAARRFYGGSLAAIEDRLTSLCEVEQNGAGSPCFFSR